MIYQLWRVHVRCDTHGDQWFRISVWPGQDPLEVAQSPPVCPDCEINPFEDPPPQARVLSLSKVA